MGEVRRWLPIDVIAMGRECEWHLKFSSQFPGCGGGFGCEVGVQHLGLELPQRFTKLPRVIDHALSQAGLRHDLVAQLFARLA